MDSKMFIPKPKAKARKQIKIVQGGAAGGGFKRGYQSFVNDSRTPFDALSDMTNVTLDQDNLPRPRESLVLHGGQPLGTVIGAGTFTKIVSGLPEKWDISMQVIGGVGKVCVRKDGDTWVAVVDADNSYSATKTVDFCQSSNQVFISNGYDAMSYYGISAGTIVKYVALVTPSAPSATGTGMAGTDFTYYYRVSANNDVGESATSTAATVTTNTIRETATWSTASKYVTVTWSAIAGSPTSYNIYVGTVTGEEKYLATVTGLKYVDDGQTSFNTFKIAPQGNSTAGPILRNMWNKDGTLFGVGDTTHPDYLWYDAGSTATGDFSPFNGGGNVSINSGGDTVPSAVRSFRTGKGDPACTVLSSGIAGTGKMHHVIFTTTTFDNNVINVPNVQEVSGQGGTVAPRSVLELDNNLLYITGQDFKSTGTSPNIQNILSTRSITNDIISDINRLNLASLPNSCGLVYQGAAYWAVPVGSTENNQIWVKDYTRKGIWIMPWIVKAKFMWLSENNDTGKISFCIYDGTNILEFSRSVYTQDNGVAFRTRVAHEGLVFDDSGMSMGAIQNQRFKYLQPAGTILANSFGLDEDGAVNTLATDTFTQTSSFTGWGQLIWSDGSIPSVYSGDVGMINFTSTAVHVTNLEIDETVNQLGWEIVTDTSGADYTLSSVLTTGILISRSYYGD